MVKLLKEKTFFTFCLAQLISQFGDGLTITVVLYLIGTISKDPFLIGLVLFSQYAPMILFGLFTGAIADRFPKHYLMVGADLYRVLIMVAMSLSTEQPFLLIFLIFLNGIGSAVFYPARSSYIPYIVGEKNITEALGISQSIFSIMQIAAPGVAGILLVFTFSSNILMMDAISYIISALLIGLTAKFNKNKEIIDINTLQRVSVWKSTKEGVVTVFRIAPLAFLIILLMQVMLVAGIFNTTSTSLLLQVFNVSRFHFGMIEAMVGIGAFVGAMMGPFILRYIKPGYLLLSSAIFMGGWMVLVATLGYFKNYFGLFPIYMWVLIIGLINAFLNIPISSLFLGLTPVTYRGRSMSILQISSNSGLLLGILGAGMLTKFLGVVSVTVVAGLLLIIVSTVAFNMKGFKTLLMIEDRPNKNKKSEIGLLNNQ